jgi:hypothetical protein
MPKSKQNVNIKIEHTAKGWRGTIIPFEPGESLENKNIKTKDYGNVIEAIHEARAICKQKRLNLKNIVGELQ